VEDVAKIVQGKTGNVAEETKEKMKEPSPVSSVDGLET
jgi:hypothetical protein